MATYLNVIERLIENYFDILFTILSSYYGIFTHEYVALELTNREASIHKKKKRKEIIYFSGSVSIPKEKCVNQLLENRHTEERS